MTHIVEDVVCQTCAHKNVCKYTEEMMLAQRAVSGATFSKSDKRITSISSLPYVKRIRLECENYICAPQGIVRDAACTATNSAKEALKNLTL